MLYQVKGVMAAVHGSFHSPQPRKANWCLMLCSLSCAGRHKPEVVPIPEWLVQAEPRERDLSRKRGKLTQFGAAVVGVGLEMSLPTSAATAE